MMPDDVTLMERQEVQDGQGGLAEEWVETYELVPARFSERGGSEDFLAGQEHREADYMLTLPFGQRITEGMRVKFKGQTFEVVFVNEFRSMATAKRCLVRLV